MGVPVQRHFLKKSMKSMTISRNHTLLRVANLLDVCPCVLLFPALPSASAGLADGVFGLKTVLSAPMHILNTFNGTSNGWHMQLYLAWGCCPQNTQRNEESAENAVPMWS